VFSVLAALRSPGFPTQLAATFRDGIFAFPIVPSGTDFLMGINEGVQRFR